MTLNVTLLTPGYIIQASDRRMVSLATGAPEDSANKGILLQTDDGVFAVTFAGVGVFRTRRGDQRVDLWLAEQMAREGVPELPIAQGVDIIAKVATALFATFRKHTDKRLTLTIAGWNTGSSTPSKQVWSISNSAGAGGSRLDKARDAFEVRRLQPRAGFYVFGLHQAIRRADRRRFQASLKRSGDPMSAELGLVHLIRAAATNPDYSWGINGNVLTVFLAPDGTVLATFHPDGSASRNYAPLFVWYDRGFNHVAGDAEIVPTSEFAYRFGRTMLVGDMGGVRPDHGTTPDIGEIGFRTAIHPAKFHPDEVEVGDIHELVALIPRTERARRIVDGMG